MKIAVWLVFAFVSLAWTGLVWVAAALTRWAADLIASGAAVDWAVAAGSIRFPAWLTWWIDPVWIGSLIDGVIWALEAASQAMPWFSSAAGWIVVLMWLAWGAGMLVMLLLAGGLHLMVSRKA